jgi:medium-chain acyl-[acyl-carrier-protein] hydrolase
VARLRDELLPHLDRPFALYGHSFGGHLGIALARALSPVRPPLALFVGASTAPSVHRQRAGQAADDDALLAWLRRLGGTPEAVLADPFLRGLVLPPLRADLRVLDDCRALPPGSLLDRPIHVFAGSGDPIAPSAAMAAWADETRGAFTQEVVEGGHLFLAETGTAVLDRIRARLGAGGGGR